MSSVLPKTARPSMAACAAQRRIRHLQQVLGEITGGEKLCEQREPATNGGRLPV
ncbi:hypothetical protein [Herbidospora galbida]|uniref:hypothetical protein n=1 Tax=Herbidospora galbida TaxID=2575442 RepID=UPI001484F1BF|nr:hypothetical protein [Herbidospora galbida]